MTGRISWFGVCVRLVGAVAIVLLTYTPTGYSFYHWALRDFAAITAVKAFAGALLLVGWVICIRTAFVSLGALGLLLSVLVLCTLVWMLKGLRNSQPRESVAYFLDYFDRDRAHFRHRSVLSLLRARVTGQVEVD